MNKIQTDILVLGAGIAGLSAAIPLGTDYRVLVVAKGEIRQCNTDLAQGGIAAALTEEDSPFDHFQDSMTAGDYLCREDALKYMVETGPARVRELIEWGARFDQVEGHLAFTREGAHRFSRILHANGDATGHEIQQTLIRHAAAIPNIQFLERSSAIHLIVHHHRCYGAICYDAGENQFLFVHARAVIIATGGVGHLYSRTTNAPTATGDGCAMAFSVGAILEDMEFVQFHPTSFAMPGIPTFLLSEAMRGEGGILRNTKMERFMTHYHPLAELAPRDVVSRAIFTEMQRESRPCVYLDMTHFKEPFLEKRFPNLFANCLRQGVHMSRDPIPVAPAAHYIMGGIRTDLDGCTNIEGLFACGECACTGVHGANRLASNSLLEGLVFGQRTGEKLRQNVPALQMNIPLHLLSHQTTEVYPQEEELRRCVQDTMWAGVGIVRSDAGLTGAIATLRNLLEAIQPVTTLATIQLHHMILVGLCIAQSALDRPTNRGGHFRSDAPPDVPADHRHIQVVNGSDGLPVTHWTRR